MRLASEYITTTLTGNPEIVAALTEGVYWELAPEDTSPPFLTYRIEETKPVSKDFNGDYRVSFFIWAQSLDAGVVIADLVKEKVKEDTSNNLKYQQGRSGYTSEDAREAYIELIFIFKL